MKPVFLVAAVAVTIGVYLTLETGVPVTQITNRFGAAPVMTAVSRNRPRTAPADSRLCLRRLQAVFATHGDAREVVSIVQAQLPLVRADDVLIEMKAAALNPVDWWAGCSSSPLDMMSSRVACTS